MAVGAYPTAINPVTGDLYYPAAVAPSTMQASDHNYLTWTYDPAIGMSGIIVPAAGTLHVTRMKLDSAALVSNIVLACVTAGVTLTSGQNFASLYSGAGVLLGSTASQHTAWQSTGLKTMALTAPVVVPAGYCYAAFYCNGSTLPLFCRGNQTSAPGGNAGLSAPNLRSATCDTGLTTAPPATLGTQTASAIAWWVALS